MSAPLQYPPTTCERCGILHGDRNGCPAPEVIASARGFVRACEADRTMSRDRRDVGGFRFAVTMADNPHWYALRSMAWEHGMGEGYDALYVLCRYHYYLRWWWGRGYRSIDLDGYSYWLIISDYLINRKPADRAGWEAPPPIEEKRP